MRNHLYVINSQGEKEPFSFWKVVQGTKKAGASTNLAKEIAAEIEREIYPGIRTSEIYRKVRKILKRKNRGAGMKFSIKQGMRKLGPSGFPFEKYIREVLGENGFKTRINVHLKGKCAFYEIDFLAEKEETLYIGECKYHRFAQERVDLKVGLYNYARFLDLANGDYFTKTQFSSLKIKPMLVTNAKFTSQTIRYSKCVGMELLGWNYPRNRGLEYFIDKGKLYPITILPSLNNYLKDIFFRNKIALARDLVSFSPKKLARKIDISQKIICDLRKEAEILLEI